MNLRPRLALVTLVATVPVIVGLVWRDAATRHSATASRLADLALREMTAEGERARCEASPQTWGGRVLPRFGGRDRVRPDGEPRLEFTERGDRGDRSERGERGRSERFPFTPPALYAYDATMKSLNPSAPTVAPGSTTDSITSTWPGADVEAIVPMPWTTGPCAVVVARGVSVPGWFGAILPASRLWLMPVAAIFLGLLIAVGPMLRRLRRLTIAVRQSAAVGYTGTIPVERPLGGDDELTELARAFVAAGKQVEAQFAGQVQREKTLREFVANTTHDVMIPLTVLKSHLTTLDDSAASGTPIDRAVLISAMDETHYLGALVHNLTIAAKLDGGEPDVVRGPVDLGELVNRVISRHRPIARQRDISLDSAAPEAAIIIDADVTMVEQAVSNVVYNAIRHNRPGGHVAVILERIDSDPNSFRVRVIDDGAGIPPEELSRLVERGFRGDAARTRSPDGQGLGLHIATRVAALHGHTLRFAASEYGGLQVDLEGPVSS